MMTQPGREHFPCTCHSLIYSPLKLHSDHEVREITCFFYLVNRGTEVQKTEAIFPKSRSQEMADPDMRAEFYVCNPHNSTSMGRG